MLLHNPWLPTDLARSNNHMWGYALVVNWHQSFWLTTYVIATYVTIIKIRIHLWSNYECNEYSHYAALHYIVFYLKRHEIIHWKRFDFLIKCYVMKHTLHFVNCLTIVLRGRVFVTSSIFMLELITNTSLNSLQEFSTVFFIALRAY